MNKSILIGIALAVTSVAIPVSATEISYSVTATTEKTYKGSKYTQFTLNCEISAKKKNRTVTRALSGFGRGMGGPYGYFPNNENPFINISGNYVIKNGFLDTFEQAAQKACSGK